jgi:DNA helicase-2/ATP-dependent DNA helicase PcrA
MEWLSKPEPRPAMEPAWDDTYGGAIKTYYDAPSAPPQKPLPRQPAARPAAPLLSLKPGEGIHHTAFGDGMVLSVRPMGGDALVEVAFDGVGTKKLMLKAAGAHITKLGGE